MLIVAAGWRRHPDKWAVCDVLDGLWLAHRPGHGPLVLVHGDCPTGADAYADWWARCRRVAVEWYPARDFGAWPWCGPRRNTAMVAEAVAALASEPVVVVAFPQPGWETARRCGTADLVRKARAAGLEVRVHPVGGGSHAAR